MSVGALYEMLATNLRDAGVWGERVYADVVPAGVVRPYVVYFVVSGGEDNVRGDRRDASYVVTIKCVGERLVDSLQGARQLVERLDDHGVQDRSGVLIDPAGWTITTITADRAVHVVERFEGAIPIYHDGHQFIIVMEAV